MFIDELLYSTRENVTRVFLESIAVCMDNDIKISSFSLPFKLSEIDEDLNGLNFIDMLEYFEDISFSIIKALFIKYGWKVDTFENFIGIPDEDESLMYPYSTFEETLMSSNGISEDDSEYELFSNAIKIISEYNEGQDSDWFGNGFSSVVVLEHPSLSAEQMTDIVDSLALSYPEYICDNKIIIPMFLLKCSTDIYVEDDYSCQVAFIFSNIWELSKKLNIIHNGASGK